VFGLRTFRVHATRYPLRLPNTSSGSPWYATDRRPRFAHTARISLSLSRSWTTQVDLRSPDLLEGLDRGVLRRYQIELAGVLPHPRTRARCRMSRCGGRSGRSR
jgi:hypothetical protein